MTDKDKFAWGHLLVRYRKDQQGFLRKHNKKRRAEAFFSKMKRRFGLSAKSRVETMQRKCVCMRCLVMNALVVTG